MMIYSAGGSIALIVVLLLVAFYLFVGWRIFTKADQPGWAVLIPIYNDLVLLRIIGRPWWWLLLLLIPFVTYIMWIVIALDVAKSFGRSVYFALGLIFLAPIFLPILAFGSSEYRGPSGWDEDALTA